LTPGPEPLVDGLIRNPAGRADGHPAQRIIHLIRRPPSRIQPCHHHASRLTGQTPNKAAVTAHTPGIRSQQTPGNSHHLPSLVPHAFGASLDTLRSMGVTVLFDPDAPYESRLPSWAEVAAALPGARQGVTR
jgi:hypothetical protein